MLWRARDRVGPGRGGVLTRWAEGPSCRLGGVILFVSRRFRAASGCSGQPSGGDRDSTQNGTFLGSIVPFCPILSHPLLLIWSVRSAARPSGDMAGDVEPRILRISRMREELRPFGVRIGSGVRVRVLQKRQFREWQNGPRCSTMLPLPCPVASVARHKALPRAEKRDWEGARAF